MTKPPKLYASQQDRRRWHAERGAIIPRAIRTDATTQAPECVRCHMRLCDYGDVCHVCERDTDDLETVPNRLLRELSAKELAPFAIRMRGERNTSHARLKQLAINLELCQDDLKEARRACKRMAEQLREHDNEPLN